MSDRKKLEEANEAYKESIETEIKEVKKDVNRLGKNALIGGAIGLSVLALASIFSTEEESKRGKKKKRKKNRNDKKSRENSGILLTSLKDEVLLIALSFAAQKISDFIQDVNEEKGEQNN